MKVRLSSGHPRSVPSHHLASHHASTGSREPRAIQESRRSHDTHAKTYESSAACAAASRATGIRRGLQLT